MRNRFLGVFDPPRRLISRCVRSLREFFYNREDGECCGGGGLVPHTFPEATAGQARRRLEEAALFDVPLVVTACPSCRRTLAGRCQDPVEVVDLINLIAWAIQDPDRRRLNR